MNTQSKKSNNALNNQNQGCNCIVCTCENCQCGTSCGCGNSCNCGTSCDC